MRKLYGKAKLVDALRRFGDERGCEWQRRVSSRTFHWVPKRVSLRVEQVRRSCPCVGMQFFGQSLSVCGSFAVGYSNSRCSSSPVHTNPDDLEIEFHEWGDGLPRYCAKCLRLWAANDMPLTAFEKSVLTIGLDLARAFSEHLALQRIRREMGKLGQEYLLTCPGLATPNSA